MLDAKAFSGWMYEKQRAAIYAPKRYSIIEASTKSGKTSGCIAWLAEQAFRGKPGQNFWWVAPVLGQSKIAFRRMRRSIPRHLYTENRSDLSLTLANDATLIFKGADHPDSLYGEDVYAAVIDEASRVKDEAWHAVRTTLTATKGPLRIIGNVKGRKNWAYKLARKAQAGEPNMAYSRITAHDAIAAGVLDVSEIEDARQQLPKSVFNELYLAIPSDDEGNPFGLTAIDACLNPLSTEPPAVWGIDLAKSVDWSVAIALSASGAVCRLERWQSSWQATILRIESLCAGAPATVDSTGVGDPILEALQANGKGLYEGYLFNAKSKQQLMEGLAVDIQRREIRFPEGVIAEELREFEYQYTRTGVCYGAPQGMHDDCVCALALARHGRTFGSQPADPDKLFFAGRRVSAGSQGY